MVLGSVASTSWLELGGWSKKMKERNIKQAARRVILLEEEIWQDGRLSMRVLRLGWEAR